MQRPRPATSEPSRVTDDDWAHARELVLRHGWNAVAYQILNPGMRLWFTTDREAVVGYAAVGRTWVVAGAPVCAPERLPAVIDELEADARRHGRRLLFFGAGTRLEQVMAARATHALVRLGAQPVWTPSEWPDVVRAKSSLRAQLNRARNKGVRVTEWPTARAQESAVLRAVLHEWLGMHGLPPLGFLVTTHLLGNLADRRVFVAERGPQSEVVGFLVATPVPARTGWLVEQWPRTRAAPNGTTQLLVDAAMRAFASAGSQYVTLGLAPLADRAGELGEGQPLWLRLALGWVRAHGRRFYDFRGLEHFKASLQPMRWEPIFAIAPRRRFTVGMLRAVAGAFSDGRPEALVAHALWRALVLEARRLATRRRDH
jgi:phosphatidylglycerol lysyltransferase